MSNRTRIRQVHVRDSHRSGGGCSWCVKAKVRLWPSPSSRRFSCQEQVILGCSFSVLAVSPRLGETVNCLQGVGQLGCFHVAPPVLDSDAQLAAASASRKAQKLPKRTPWLQRFCLNVSTCSTKKATWNSCRTLLWDTLEGHSYLTLLWDTLVRHSCGTLL